MKFLSRWTIPVLSVFTLLLGISLYGQLNAPSDATTEVGKGGTATFNQYDNNIGIRMLLQTEVFQKDTYVVLDYSQQQPVLLHRAVNRTLAFGEGETTLKFLSDGMSLEISRDDLVESPPGIFEPLTEDNEEINETLDVTAKLGWPILKHFSIKFDFDSQTVVLTPAAERTVEDVMQEYALVVRGVAEVENQVRVPVIDKDSNLLQTVFGINSYHTVIDQGYAVSRGFPSGNVPDIRFTDGESELPVSEMAAMMPVPVALPDTPPAEAETEEMVAPDENVVEPEPFDESLIDSQPMIYLGFSLLSGYTLELNPQNGFLALTQIKNSNIRQEDLDFYAAVGASDRFMFDEYLADYPEDRHVEEAVWRRFILGIEAEDSVEVQLANLEKGLHVQPDKNKFVYMNNYVQYCAFNSVDPDLSIALGEKSLEFVAYSTTPSQRQGLQLYLGDLYFEKGDIDQAWSYYLSGSFNGDPRGEMVVKYKLATVYEAQERWRRAYANYARALRGQSQLPESMAIGAQEGLTRIREYLDPDDPLIKEAEELAAYVSKALNLGEPLTVVKAQNLAGEEVSLDQYLGKVVLIDVWATWCGPCIAGIPKMREVAKQFEGTDFVLLSVSADDRIDTVTDFLEDTDMPWDHWFIGPSGDVHNEWNIRGYPTYMLIDKEGNLLARGHGLTDAMIQQIAERIEQI